MKDVEVPGAVRLGRETEPFHGAAFLDDQLRAGVGGGLQDPGFLALVTENWFHALR
jgi:hypothetical protein